MKNYDLKERLIDYEISISRITEKMEISKLGLSISGQLIRSGSAPALNYGETQSAESRNDVVHKLGIVLKELKESKGCLRIV